MRALTHRTALPLTVLYGSGFMHVPKRQIEKVARPMATWPFSLTVGGHLRLPSHGAGHRHDVG